MMSMVVSQTRWQRAMWLNVYRHALHDGSDHNSHTARPEHTVWGGAIAPSHGERGSTSLWWGLGAMLPVGSGAKPLVRGSRGEAPEAESNL